MRLARSLKPARGRAGPYACGPLAVSSSHCNTGNLSLFPDLHILICAIEQDLNSIAAVPLACLSTLEAENYLYSKPAFSKYLIEFEYLIMLWIPLHYICKCQIYARHCWPLESTV